MGRKSNGEVQARRVDVLDMVLRGKPRQFIISYLATNYGVRVDCVDNDIAACKAEIKKLSEKHREEVMELHISRYEKIYDDCIEAGNVRDALKAMNQKETLMQLLKTDPLVQVNTLNLSAYSTEELKQIKGILNKNE